MASTALLAAMTVTSVAAPALAKGCTVSLGVDPAPATIGDGDVVCGTSGADLLYGITMTGGRFLGGDGDDHIDGMSGGTFDGGAGHDGATVISGGKFNGGVGDDFVAQSGMSGGTFNRGVGDDTIFGSVYGSGTFNGGIGHDFVYFMSAAGATFAGGPGADLLGVLWNGPFYGGSGSDTINEWCEPGDGVFYSVEDAPATLYPCG